MTTKEQERKALEQIKKILAGLEEDSYVVTAMRGMVEDAESNIENDWAGSMYDRWQTAGTKLCDAERKIAELEAELACERSLRESAEAKVLTTVQNVTIQRLLGTYRNELSERNAEYERKILDTCDSENTDTDAFRALVHGRKIVNSRINNADTLIEVLEAQIRPQ